LRQINKNELFQILKRVASEAASLYSDHPLDYKGRVVTPQGVVETGLHPNNADIVEATVGNTFGERIRILDVGVAYGIYDVVLKRMFGFEVYGIDHPANMNSYCRYPIQQGIQILPCDPIYEKLPYADETFDTIIASEVVEHLLISPKVLFSKIYPLVKPGGKLIVTTPNFASLHNITLVIRGFNPAGQFPDKDFLNRKEIIDPRVHPREYTVREIEEALLDSGFKIFSIQTKTNNTTNGCSWKLKFLQFLTKFTPKHKERIVAIGVR